MKYDVQVELARLQRHWQYEEWYWDTVGNEATSVREAHRQALERLHTVRGSMMGAQLLRYPDSAGSFSLAHALNEQLALAIDAKLQSADVASLSTTVRQGELAAARSDACRRALAVAMDERSRCSQRDASVADDGCAEAQAVLAAARANADAVATAVSKAAVAKDEIEGRLGTLHRRLIHLQAEEKRTQKSGNHYDNTADMLQRTNDEMSRSWLNLADALKAELAQESWGKARQLTSLRRYDFRQQGDGASSVPAMAGVVDEVANVPEAPELEVPAICMRGLVRRTMNRDGLVRVHAM